MFIDLHCNSTQTQQRLRGRESTQIQCHERVSYASASRPAALQGHNFFRVGTNTAMFIDLHCNSTQTQQRLRGRESTQIQCHERVSYASASRPAALQGHKFFRGGTNTAMFIDLHCNSTQTQQRLRGRESTQIQCHERVSYASASRPAALQGHKFFRGGTNTAMFIDPHC